jgi:hypothetical protein
MRTDTNTNESAMVGISRGGRNAENHPGISWRIIDDEIREKLSNFIEGIYTVFYDKDNISCLVTTHL